VPVSVAVDEEGGRVQRIDELDGSVPSARKMAQTIDAQVRQLGKSRVRAMSALGITVDYAPDTDVSEQPDRSVIGDRSLARIRRSCGRTRWLSPWVYRRAVSRPC
jgi:beta-N-acetylhexosaminidase